MLPAVDAVPRPALADGVLRFWMPWALFCSDNRKYVTRQILSEQYRTAKDQLAAYSALMATAAGWALTDAPVSLRLVVTEPDASRNRDLSFSKQVKDAVTAGGRIWVDDWQVREEHWRYLDRPDPVTPGAWVSIAKLGGLPFLVA